MITTTISAELSNVWSCFGPIVAELQALKAAPTRLYSYGLPSEVTMDIKGEGAVVAVMKWTWFVASKQRDYECTATVLHKEGVIHTLELIWEDPEDGKQRIYITEVSILCRLYIGDISHGRDAPDKEKVLDAIKWRSW